MNVSDSNNTIFFMLNLAVIRWTRVTKRIPDQQKTARKINMLTKVKKHFYTPGIYAEGYIVFAFPFVLSSVRMFVRSFVRPSRSWNLRKSFSQSCVQVSQVECIWRSIRQKAFIFGPWLLTPGCMPQGGARGPKTPLKSVFLLFCYENNLCR